MTQAPLIAIVGRPNVGKSTLFNRLVGGRPALVYDTPGLTRDRRYGQLEYFGSPLRIVDTGGLDLDAQADAITAGIHRHAAAALAECDAVIFVLDVLTGPTAADRDLAAMLRKMRAPILCAANKADSSKRELLVGDVYQLSVGDVYPVSAEHGRGIDALLEAIVQKLGLPKNTTDCSSGTEDDKRRLRVTFVGKPNAGKSSIVNRLVGAERSLVHDTPGTTTDPIDVEFDLGGSSYVLVDTAGIRRRARIDETTEKLSVSFSLAQIRRSQIVVLVVDAVQGPSEQDARLASMIEDSGRGIVLALNKSDLLVTKQQQKQVMQRTKDTFRFVSYAPIVFLSALRGDGIHPLMQKVDKIALSHARRIPTAEVNRFFREVTEHRPPPLHKGRAVRIQYLTQARVRPPTFVLWTNRADGIAPAYRRYLVNQLRNRYDFHGAPIRLLVKKKKQSGRTARHQTTIDARQI